MYATEVFLYYNLKMEKLPMCRICLVQNVRMFAVVNSNLRELYEKLTDIPFLTEDSRPILACFVCCIRLKQCYQLQRQCHEAEELFAQKMNKGYEPNILINQDHFKFYSGFIKSPTENISIVDESHTAYVAIKDELPAVCEGLVSIIEPKEELQSDQLELEHFNNSCLDVADIEPNDSESDLKFEVALMGFKTELKQEQEVSKKKQSTREKQRATVAKNLKLDTRIIQREDARTAKQTRKDKSDSKCIQTTQKLTSKPGTYYKESYKCDHSRLNQAKKTMQHTRTQKGENPYECDVCQRSFSNKCTLTRHTRIHTGEKPYKCDVCQRSYSEKGTLTKHIRVHTGEKPYKCDLCKCCFKQRGHLSKHILKHGKKPFMCDLCQRSFSEKDTLTKHIRIHTGEDLYKCDVCHCSFSNKSNLTKHIRIHTGEKPFKCVVCQCSFRETGHLIRHIRIHTGEKPYKCDVCQRSFSNKCTLTRHNRVHTGEKPYKCDLCQRTYREKGTLTKHIRIHTGEKP